MDYPFHTFLKDLSGRQRNTSIVGMPLRFFSSSPETEDTNASVEDIPQPPVSWVAFEEAIGYLPFAAKERVRRAFEAAKDAHAGAVTAAKTMPDFAQSTLVASMMGALKADEETLVALFLYHAVERGCMQLDDVQTTFGIFTSALVTDLLRVETQSNPTQRDFNPVAETFRKRLMLMQGNMRLCVMALVDELFLLRRFKRELSANAQHAQRRAAGVLYMQLADKVCMRDIYEEMQSLLIPSSTSLALQHAQSFERCRSILEELCLLQGHLDVQFISDLPLSASQPISIAIVCPNLDRCYDMLRVLHQNFRQLPDSFHDYINRPDINGYQGLHTSILLQDHVKIDCKIRTQEMQEYAHIGIASLCFQQETIGLQEYVPWVQRIDSLSEATQTSSHAFIQSLMSDIFTDFIKLYNTEGKMLFMPAHATALDAAFFFEAERALRTQKILINEENVPKSFPAKDNALLEIVLSDERTVSRKWLSQVHTFYSQSVIRSALGTLSRAGKIAVGKAGLQEVMHSKKKGFLEEFEESGFLPSLESLGYISLDEACIAVAEGKMDATDLYRGLFEPNVDEFTLRTCSVYCTIDIHDTHAIGAVLQVAEKYHAIVSGIRKHRWSGKTTGSILLHIQLSTIGQEYCAEALKAAGAQEVSIETNRRHWSQMFSVVAVIVLWTVDPVVAAFLVSPSVGADAMDFTMMRFLSFFLACSAVALVERYRRQAPLRKIPLGDPFLWMSGVSLFTTAFATYASLNTLLPQEYITMTYTFGALFPVIHPLLHLSPRLKFISPTMVLPIIIASLLLLKILRPSLPWEGWILGMIAAIAFMILTLCTDAYKRRNRIQARLSTFFITLSGIALLCSSSLLPLTGLPPANTVTLALFLHGIIFTTLPYLLYYNILTTIQWRLLVTYFAPGISLTLVGQYLLFGTLSLPSLLPLILICAVTWSFYRYYRYPLLPEKQQSSFTHKQ